MWFTTLVMYMYPPAGDLIAMQEAVGQILGGAPNIWAILLVFAIAPAIMEDVALDARSRMETCKGCQGEGTVNTRRCPQCEGEGLTRVPGDHQSRKLLFQTLGLIGK